MGYEVLHTCASFACSKYLRKTNYDDEDVAAEDKHAQQLVHKSVMKIERTSWQEIESREWWRSNETAKTDDG